MKQKNVYMMWLLLKGRKEGKTVYTLQTIYIIEVYVLYIL